MKRKKVAGLIGTIVLLAAIGIGATLAYFTDTDTKTNVITMGDIDIELTEPSFSKDSTIGIVPNELIEKDPTITVKAGSKDAYIRAKVTYEWDEGNGTATPLTGDELEALKNNITWRTGWVASTLEGEEDVWYYQYVVGETNIDQKIVLFDQVLIPNWGNDVAGKKLNITIEASGIQADNFNPERSGEVLSDNVRYLHEIEGPLNYEVVGGELMKFPNAMIGWHGATPEKYSE
ncbi:MAG TPA: hypothetical protein IAC62_02475 [Candidatus Pelethocola excrementipullorum]|nr:hypothetical protein [Candidatus Pelethocola excrementipullorum]